MKGGISLWLSGIVFGILGEIAEAVQCYLPLDVMFLQDTTGSFDDDLPNVVRQIPSMVQQILADHPDSHFGVAEFKDKPYFPLGEKTDFCYKLGWGALTSEMLEFQWAYQQLYASGGGDLPEATFQALINVALDVSVGWRPLKNQSKGGRLGPRPTEEGPLSRALAKYDAGAAKLTPRTRVRRLAARETPVNAGARLVILSTDAIPHQPGDISKYDHSAFPELPESLPPNTGGIADSENLNKECVGEDYPTPEQVRRVLREQQIFLAILTPNDPAIVPAWKWVNENLLGQPPSFYQFIQSDSRDLVAGVISAINAVTQTACPTSPPTLSPPEETSAPNEETSVAQTPTKLAPTTLTPTTVTTVAPTTVIPTTVAPTTVIPTTVAPTTVIPTTVAPTTVIPTTVAPTTVIPTTFAPTTVIPTTVAPTTVIPTTIAPTTVIPTTIVPTTVIPTTIVPTTAIPTTVVRTTVAPTTILPSPVVSTSTIVPRTTVPTTVAPSALSTISITTSLLTRTPPAPSSIVETTTPTELETTEDENCPPRPCIPGCEAPDCCDGVLLRVGPSVDRVYLKVENDHGHKHDN